MRVAAVQFAPVFLDTPASLERMLARIHEAAKAGAEVIAFPETALSGYPGWLSETGGAQFDDADQKAAYACYLEAAVEEGGPELQALETAAKDLGVYLVVGIIERGKTIGRGSTYASLFRVGPRQAAIVHRKLVPTYEERLVWAPGDASGLVVHEHNGLRIGALNCWENWMPLARAALYQEGEELHISAWPGSAELTRDISRFTAREGRVFVLAASGVMRGSDVPASFPLRSQWVQSEDQVLRSGGSRILAPDGRELASMDEPEEGILYADLELTTLHRERQNFDPCGHYSRPELLKLQVDRRRFREPETPQLD